MSALIIANTFGFFPGCRPLIMKLDARFGMRARNPSVVLANVLYYFFFFFWGGDGGTEDQYMEWQKYTKEKSKKLVRNFQV